MGDVSVRAGRGRGRWCGPHVAVSTRRSGRRWPRPAVRSTSSWGATRCVWRRPTGRDQAGDHDERLGGPASVRRPEPRHPAGARPWAPLASETGSPGVNDSAVLVLGDEALRDIARELVETVRANLTIGWARRESVRAKSPPPREARPAESTATRRTSRSPRPGPCLSRPRRCRPAGRPENVPMTDRVRGDVGGSRRILARDSSVLAGRP